MKQLASAFLVTLLGLGLAALLLPLRGYSDEAASPTTEPEYRGWPKPDVVLMITGQQHGYIEPCGCTGLSNQKGGLARRDSLLQSLIQQRQWDVVPLDAGDQVRRIGSQAAIKYQTTINALRQMKYAAVGFGGDDLRLPLGELLAVIAASTDDQGQSDLFVCANANPLGFVSPYRIIERGGLRIGVTAAIGAEALARVTHEEIVKQPASVGLAQAVERMKAERCDFCVALVQAPPKECEALARQVKGIDLIVSAGGYGEPKFRPDVVAGTSTQLIQTGAKSMYVGVVGLYRGRPIQLRYQRVALDARHPDSPRMLENMKQYQAVLQNQGLAGLGLKPVRHVHGKFVGSETCGECHTQAYDKWLKTPHHHATDSIANPTERSEIVRHHDPECLSCHVTGWNPQAYFPYETGYIDLEKSAPLHGSGCENCHGPGDAHVRAENGEANLSEEQLLESRRQMRLELSKAEEKCLECHDLDNSPDFHAGEGAFEKYWKQVEHPWLD